MQAQEKDSTLILREERSPSPFIVHYFINILAGVLWAFWAYNNIRQAFKAPEFSWEAFLYFTLFFRNSSLTILFLIRRPAKASSKQIKEWLVAFLGTFISVFYSIGEGHSLIPSYNHSAIYVVMILAIVLSVLAILSLGRSFGIVPANRGIQSRGLYSIVRHPIYACYIIFDIAFMNVRFSWLNLFVFCTSLLAFYLRAIYEERFLRMDPAYREYVEKTRYMFLPGII